MRSERPEGAETSRSRPASALTRRGFLGSLAAGAAITVLDPLDVAEASEGHDEPDEHGHEDAEQGESQPTSQRVRRWAMVIDLRKCDGCMELEVPPQCAQHCTWARYVPQDHRWLEVFEERPGGDELPGGRPVAFPMLCYHCENAPCVNVCPVGATFHAPEGTVLIDQERCIGCRLCMAACPYDRRFFNWEEPVQPDWVKDSPYDVRTQTPAIRGTVMKCDFCTDRAEVGGLPACVLGCPRGAVYYGDLEEDVATNGADIVTLSEFLHDEGAYRYKEELGTKPRVWYIPGSGQAVPRTHHDEVLNARLEWPWLAMAGAEESEAS